jgi:hypothetical protein
MNSTKDITKTNKNKKKYKVRNWNKYNQALIARGSLTLWISDDITDWWYAENGKETYSDRAIETVLTLKAQYGLPLRATVGFAISIMNMMNKVLNMPDYSTLSRRAKTLHINLKKQKKDNIHVSLDSSGVKIYGEGEWKVRQHGWSKRRTWTKIHIGIDDDSEIRAVVTTGSDTHDCEVIDDILKQEDAVIDGFRADGAYDMAPVYMSLVGREVQKIMIPPRRDAVIQIHGNTKGPPYPRDENLRAIRKSTRKQWKRESGYHGRSRIETTMYRFKTTFGDRLSFRNRESQGHEVLIKCNILNTYHRLGMPESYVAETG